VVEGWLSAGEEAALVAGVDAGEWSTDIARRVQQYGLRYTGRTGATPTDAGPLPPWLDPLLNRLLDEGFARRPEQVNVNEYLPGQGIARHTDIAYFGPVVAIVSLLSATTMVFEQPETGARCELRIEPRSLVVLSGESRSTWQHSIPKRRTDVVAGLKVPRQRRISLTFRTTAARV
jgi:alkylated DNA repair dioxygenase AlkB